MKMWIKHHDDFTGVLWTNSNNKRPNQSALEGIDAFHVTCHSFTQSHT